MAGFAEKGLILVLPEGESSYYKNSVDRPQDRFEDYIVKDLIEMWKGSFPRMLPVGRSQPSRWRLWHNQASLEVSAAIQLRWSSEFVDRHSQSAVLH